jgi:hypothetical protein
MITRSSPLTNGARVAKKVETVFTDDLDGSNADTTIRFGLDGAEYEIDLSAAHADEFRTATKQYIGAGRKASVASRRSTRGSARHTSASSGPASSDIRDWAKDQNHEVKERDRIPAELVVKFQAATDV